MNLKNLEKVAELAGERKTLRYALHCLSSGCELQVYNPNTNSKYKLEDEFIVSQAREAIKERMNIIDKTLECL